MVLLQCVNAYMAAQSMMDMELDYQTAYAVVALRRELRGPVEFYQKEERRLLEEYAARDDKGKIIWSESGRFVLQDPVKAEEYEARRRELGTVDVQKEFSPLRVPEPERIRPAILEALDGFLIFGEEEMA